MIAMPRFRPFRIRTAVLAVLLLGTTPAATAQERFRKSPPAPDPLPSLRLPLIESFTLSNGLILAIAPRTDSRMSVVQLVIQAGEADAPARLPGVAAVVAGLMGRGTIFLSAADIEDRIEALGGSYEIAVTPDATTFSFVCLEEDLDRALDLLKIMILEAAFQDRELDVVKRTIRYDILSKLRDPEYIARRQLLRALFAGHPYETATYSEDALRVITRKDAEEFYARFYRPNNAVLVLAGNYNLTTASRKVSRAFNTWVAQPVERAFIPTPVPNAAGRVCFVDMPQARDAVIFVGNVAMPQTSPEFFPWLVLNQVLGGTTGSRLFMNLRESRGYAYYAFSGADFFRSCGVYWARARVTPEFVYPAVQEILKELQALAAERLPAFEFEQAKSFLIGNFPLRLDSPDAFARRAAQVKAMNLGDEHWSRYYDAIMNVSLERVLDAAQKVFLPKPAVVIVGGRERVVDYLRDFEAVEIYDARGVLKSTIRKGVEK
jgi:zinc protease